MNPRILLLIVTFVWASNATIINPQTRRGLSTDLSGTQWEAVWFAQGVGTVAFEEDGRISGFAVLTQKCK